MEYAFDGHRKNDLVKLDVKINGELAEPLALIVHRDKAYSVGKALVNKLKEFIPRQMFKVPIQVNTRVAGRERQTFYSYYPAT